jgi:hypothetical protein
MTMRRGPPGPAFAETFLIPQFYRAGVERGFVRPLRSAFIRVDIPHVRCISFSAAVYITLGFQRGLSCKFLQAAVSAKALSTVLRVNWGRF